MSSLSFLIPGDLHSRTGGYGYDRRLALELRRLGWTVDIHLLDRSYPMPTAAAKAQAAETLAHQPDGQLVLIDGLAFGAMDVEAAGEHRRLRLVALVHHPLASETGIDALTARRLERSEKEALAHARLVCVTSRATLRSLAPYEVPPDRIVVAEPGTDPGPLAKGSRSDHIQLLCVASVTPRKGYQTLIQALGQLRDLQWRLTCVGSLDRAPDTAQRVVDEAIRLTIDDRVSFLGELGEEAVAACYDDADLFVLPTFHEGYGMAVAEAVARGLPVISTPTGGIPDLIGEDAGVLVAAGDVDGLTGALRTFMTDARARTRFREGAQRRRHLLPSWTETASVVSVALSKV